MTDDKILKFFERILNVTDKILHILDQQQAEIDKLSFRNKECENCPFRDKCVKEYEE